MLPGEGELSGTLNPAHLAAGSSGRAQPTALRRALSQNWEHGIMKGNFRTMKGNPFCLPYSPAWEIHRGKKLQPQTLLLAFKREPALEKS